MPLCCSKLKWFASGSVNGGRGKIGIACETRQSFAKWGLGIREQLFDIVSFGQILLKDSSLSPEARTATAVFSAAPLGLGSVMLRMASSAVGPVRLKYCWTICHYSFLS